MKMLLEINILGDIFLFENNLTNEQCLNLYDFTISYVNDIKNNSQNFSIENYIKAVSKFLSINLTHYVINKVISV